jgi:hypothetical protein
MRPSIDHVHTSRKKTKYELEQLLQHIEEHELSNIGKRTLVEQLLDDVRSSDPMRRKGAEDFQHGSKNIKQHKRNV